MELKAAAKMGSCDRLSRNLPSQQLTVQHFKKRQSTVYYFVVSRLCTSGNVRCFCFEKERCFHLARSALGADDDDGKQPCTSPLPPTPLPLS
jgi:hypothetical protein